MVTSSFVPMLNTSPTARGWSIKAKRARTMSLTSAKQRDWRPSPWMVIGRPVSACLMNVGTTMPYWPVCRGPTVLNKRTITVGASLPPVRQRQELVDRLGTGITPASLRCRPEYQVALFTERNLRAQSIDLGSRCDQDFLFLLVGLGEHDLGPVHVGFDRANRALDNQSDAHGRRQVKDHVALVNQLGHRCAWWTLSIT